MTIPSQAALTHLRSIKPNDGWSVQKSNNNNNFKLLRRNVPLSDTEFLDIHYCPTKNIVVGVMTTDGKTCQLLVDSNGKPVSTVKIVSVSTYTPGTAAPGVNFATARSNARTPQPPPATQRSPRGAAGGHARPRNLNETEIPTLTPEQNREILKFFLMFIGLVVVMKILAADTLLYTLVIIVSYLYMVQTCPSMNSFDAKKELKRVLRGHHLPEDHPDKPKGFLAEFATRVAASVTTELATFPGYEISMTPFGGAFILAEVRVPTAKLTCYWVGAFYKWNYVYSREIPDTQHYD